MSLFNAFSPLNGGEFGTYYNDRTYPLDLNGSQDYGRPALTQSPFPYPETLGFVQGLVPQFNGLELQAMWGKKAFGPWMEAPQGSFQLAFPDIQGSMMKVSG